MFFFLMIRRPPRSTRTDTLVPYTTLVRSPDRQMRRLFSRDRGGGGAGWDGNAPCRTPLSRMDDNTAVPSGDRRRRKERYDCGPGIRSEEHTSELQSLMRTSYAVFCLKKKNNTRPPQSFEVHKV